MLYSHACTAHRPIGKKPDQEFLANGASTRLQLERLPAYALELNPGEGLRPQLKGVERRNVCCFNIPHLRHELCDAVKRVRRKPQILQGFFRGAGLYIFMSGQEDDARGLCSLGSTTGSVKYNVAP
jgi:hypothetical protein